MPTIKDSLYFNYNGVSCRDYNLMNVNLDNGMFEETFHANRSINETAIRGSDTPLLNDVTEDPLEFQLTLAFTKQWTDADIDNIIVWLFQDVYKPLYFEDKPNKIYYCMPVGDAGIAHTGMKQGYLTVTMRCKSSKVYSPNQTTPIYDLSVNYIENPSIAPILSLVANPSSTLTAGVYHVGYTWYNSTGETMLGSYAIPSINVSAGNNLEITLPAKPSNATGAKVYVGTSSAQLSYQGVTGDTVYSISTPINTTNNTLPTSNSTSTEPFNITINNNGHVDIYPEISITKIGAGNIIFTKNGEIFEVRNLTNQEDIYINCEKEIIETDAIGIYRYSDVVGDFYDLILTRGENVITIQGSCKVQFRYVFKYKF